MSAAELQGRNTTFESVSGRDFLSVAGGPSDFVASQWLSHVERSIRIRMRLPPSVQFRANHIRTIPSPTEYYRTDCTGAWFERAVGTVTLEPSPEDKLHAKLFSYLDLSPDWDGRGGVVPSLQAVLDALGFLARRPSGIPLPFPQIASDGEVGLYWRSEVVHAEVGFCGDGEFSYYARYTPHGGEFSKCGRDGCTVRAGPWPADLTRILDKLSQENV